MTLVVESQAPPTVDSVLSVLTGRVPVFHTAAIEAGFLERQFAHRHVRLPPAADTEALGRRSLSPLFTVNVERVEVDLPGHNGEVTACLDTGLVAAGAREGRIDRRSSEAMAPSHVP